MLKNPQTNKLKHNPVKKVLYKDQKSPCSDKRITQLGFVPRHDMLLWRLLYFSAGTFFSLFKEPNALRTLQVSRKALEKQIVLEESVASSECPVVVSWTEASVFHRIYADFLVLLHDSQPGNMWTSLKDLKSTFRPLSVTRTHNFHSTSIRSKLEFACHRNRTMHVNARGGHRFQALGYASEAKESESPQTYPHKAF